jgi:hypothetical protein
MLSSVWLVLPAYYSTFVPLCEGDFLNSPDKCRLENRAIGKGLRSEAGSMYNCFGVCRTQTLVNRLYE